jgi:hypothetical protein
MAEFRMGPARRFVAVSNGSEIFPATIGFIELKPGDVVRCPIQPRRCPKHGAVIASVVCEGKRKQKECGP